MNEMLRAEVERQVLEAIDELAIAVAEILGVDIEIARKIAREHGEFAVAETRATVAGSGRA